MKESNRMHLTSDVDTVTGVIDLIESRHPELGISDPKHMVAFLRDPLTPHLLRGHATGAFGFIADLRDNSRHSNPIIQPWRDDPTKPTLDTSGKHPRTSSEFRDAAYEHRKEIAALPAEDLSEKGVFGSGLKYSRGCPVRFETFRTDIEALTVNGLHLSQYQLEDMMSGNLSTVRKIEDNGYGIIKDGYATVVNVLADALELTAL